MDAWTGPWLDVFRTAERGIPTMSDRNPSVLRVKDLLGLEGEISKEAILREFAWAPKQRALAWTSLRKSIQMFAPDDASAPEARVRTCSEAHALDRHSAAVRHGLAPLEAPRESG